MKTCEKTYYRHGGHSKPVRFMQRIEIKKDIVGEFHSVDALFSKLNDKFDGKWVAIMKDGNIIAETRLEDIYAKVSQSDIGTLFQASRSGKFLL
jgi:hypothetical protein